MLDQINLEDIISLDTQFAGLNKLRDYLDDQSPGKITDKGALESLLYDCWDDLFGSEDQGVAADKLIGRL